MKALRFFLLLVALAWPGCIEAAQEPVMYDAVAVRRGNGTVVVDGWTVTVTRADLALGPFYFCAATSGSATLCASAAAEVSSVAVVNALGPAPTTFGKVHGFSGVVQSASYDLGISWFDTQIAPVPAPLLVGGHSLHLEAMAEKGAFRFPIVADVDVLPQYQGQNAISTSPATGNVTSSATRLEVVMDPAGWMKQLRYDAMAASVVVGQPFVIMPGSLEHGAMLVGLKNLAPLELRFVSAP